MRPGPPCARTGAALSPGFTLIELLVVIAVVGILASLVLPALARVKQAAHLAICASNLKQIGLATALYIHDHGAYPAYWYTTSVQARDYRPSCWTTQLDPYVSNWDRQYKSGVYRCPGAPGALRVGSSIIGIRSDWVRSYDSGLHYGMNSQGTDGTTPRGLDGDWPEPPTPLPETIPAVTEASIRAPSDMVAFGDHVMENAGARPAIDPTGRDVLVGYFSYWEGQSRDPARLLALPEEARRHRGLFNVVFCDTHVESLKPSKLFGLGADSNRRWNRDHEVHGRAIRP